MARVLSLCTALFGSALVLAATGCGQQPGLVELAWQFDDAGLERMFPQGSLSNTCALPSADGLEYALQVQLRIVTNDELCTADPSLPSCQVIAPLIFDCNRFRGTAKQVATSDPDDSGEDPGYLMFAEVLIQPSTSAEPFVADPSCIQGPGPRVRSVRSGRLTDLEVYQFVFSSYSSGGAPVDIEACRGETGGSETGGSETGGSETGGSETGP